MEINKLLTITTPGYKMPMFDLSNKDCETVNKEDLIFTNLDNLFITIAPCDLTALDKLGTLHNVKKGDYIIKSNCREIYFILSPNDTLTELIKKVVEIEESKKVTSCGNRCEPIPLETCCESREPDTTC